MTTATTRNTLVNFRIPEDLDQRFTNLANATDRPKSFYLRQALLEKIAIFEAIYISEQRLAELRAGKVQAVPLDDALREFELNVDG